MVHELEEGGHLPIILAGGESEEEEGEGDDVPYYDLFDSFKPEDNKHRTFEFKSNGAEEEAEEEEEEA